MQLAESVRGCGGLGAGVREMALEGVPGLGDGDVEDVRGEGGDEVVGFDAEALGEGVYSLGVGGFGDGVAEKLVGYVLHSE